MFGLNQEKLEWLCICVSMCARMVVCVLRRFGFLAFACISLMVTLLYKGKSIKACAYLYLKGLIGIQNKHRFLKFTTNRYI